ncbi:hypothetical protein MKX03_011294 [Papaver bracteatum]|nr:hypothetical protein MKX03_011294 [Papaver bracteatum]
MEDDKEIGGSSDEEDDEGEDHDELGEFGDYEDNEVYDEIGITCAGVEVASSEGLHARVTNCTPLFLFYTLQHILLQPEEELLALRSSIPLIKGSSHKSKKSIGRVNVQEEALRCCLSNLRSTSSSRVRQETYTCICRPKSSNDDKPVRMQLGPGQTHLFPGKYCGCVVAQIDTFIEEPVGAKVRWFPIYHDPEHELVGRMHLFIKYNIDESGDCECGSVAETVAYDFVLEVATKAQHFQQRNMVLHGEWKWLLTEFASCYGISDAYARLRYLSYVMDVATPTADWLILVYDLLYPIKMEGSARSILSHQENRILGEIEGQLEHILSLAFENYKALDESSLSGLKDDFRPGTGSPVLALAPSIKLYNRLHDIISPDTQLKICRYFQAIADAEKALVVALEKKYEDVLSPFKENFVHKFGLKHVQKLARRSACIYEVPKEVTVVLLRLEYCVLSYGFQP